MPTGNLPGLVVELEARIDKFERGLKRANTLQRTSSRTLERRASQSADKMRNSYGRAGDAVSAGLKKMMLPLLGSAALAGVTRNVASTVSEIAKIGDAAKLAGVSTTALQEWQFVGRQNRIELDTVADGLKELSLRADEFVLTGSGSAGEAFARLGYDATELAIKLKDPSELLLEVFERMKSLDTAGRIRVSDELFGGSAGERFVQLIDQGEAGLRRTIERGHELGAVLDNEAIAKAQELDRRWSELQARMGSFWKGFAVGAADAATQVAGLSADIDDMFRSRAQAEALLGNGVATSLDADSAAARAGEVAIGQLRQQYEGLADDAGVVAAALEQSSIQMRSWGYDEQAAAIAETASKMRSLGGDMRDGTVDAEAFEEGMDNLASAALTAFGELDAVDKVEFGAATSGLEGFIAKLGQAVEVARSLRSTLPGGSDTGLAAPIVPAREVGSFWDDPQSESLVNPGTANAPTTSIRPRAAPAMLGEPSIETDKPISNAGGGRKTSDYEAALNSIAAETAALQAESAALIAVAGSGKEYGDAIETARAKAELLLAAQRSGITVTPELDAKLDELAEGYANAGHAADEAANKILEVQAASERGAAAVSDIFFSIASGAKTAKQALGELVIQLAKVAIQKQMTAAAGGAGGGLLGGLGSLLGFAGGGYTGHGAKYEPAGIVHKGEFVMSKAATSRIGAGNLNRLHTSALRGYADGGLVGAAKSLGSASNNSTAPVVTISAPITVNGSSGTEAQNADLAEKMGKEMEHRMRLVVGEEMQRQMRPGAMLNRR